MLMLFLVPFSLFLAVFQELDARASERGFADGVPNEGNQIHVSIVCWMFRTMKPTIWQYRGYHALVQAGIWFFSWLIFRVEPGGALSFGGACFIAATMHHWISWKHWKQLGY